jgi:hypothetical protein
MASPANAASATVVAPIATAFQEITKSALLFTIDNS